MKMGFMSSVGYVESGGLEFHLHHSNISNQVVEFLMADLNLG